MLYVPQEKLYSVSHSERKKNLCSLCRGYRGLCGKSVCPILVRARALLSEDIREVVFGASPPAVFIGSAGYPKVMAGPLVPPLDEDTAIMDTPELWVNRSLQEIVGYRASLIRGKSRVEVTSASNPDRTTAEMQELVIASLPTDVEAVFEKRPNLSVSFSTRAPPSGPSAMLKELTLAENPKVERTVDKIVYDTDMKADEGVIELYSSGIPQSRITKILSAGLLGTGKKRRFVPTEWSITATDDIIAKALRKEVLEYREIDDYMLFNFSALANSVHILLFPSSWFFEAQEVWITSNNPVIGIDYELAMGRKGYAKDLEGAYYAARLPVLEHLSSIKRQAGALVILEVYPDWIPLGVWRFRELCREAFKSVRRFDTLNEALSALSQNLALPLRRYSERSVVLKSFLSQKKLTDYSS
jgi:hypothetical protein